MTRRELAMTLAGLLLLGGVTLWGAIALIDIYAFTDDSSDVATQHQ